jgi:hypothetical protein
VPNPREYGFDERLRFADGHAPSLAAVDRVLLNRIPGALTVVRADIIDDKAGTDFWVKRQGLPALSVDMKIRADDWSVKPPDYPDDLALESWSVVPVGGHTGIVGWTRNAAKRSDFILWYWRDTGRFFLVSFPALCCVFSRLWQDWRAQFKTRAQSTPGADGRCGWQSECIFVPRSILVETLAGWQSSSVPGVNFRS